MTDAEYDRLESELEKLDPNHPVLAAVGATPTDDAGDKGTSKNKAKKNALVTHDSPMLSLKKAKVRVCVLFFFLLTSTTFILL